MHCLIHCIRLQVGALVAWLHFSDSQNLPSWVCCICRFQSCAAASLLAGMVANFCPAAGSDFVVTTLSSLLCRYFSLSAPVSDSLLPFCTAAFSPAGMVAVFGPR